MLSGFSRKLWIITILTVVFILFAGKSASGVTTNPALHPRAGGPAAVPPTLAEVQARLTQGFGEILDFFAERDFSLLAAWREMRASGDPMLLEHKYPAISKELDEWAATLSKVDVSEATVGRLDFTFILGELAPVVLDGRQSEIRRDNALLTACMICMMDDLRCDADLFHRFLATVVADDSSPARKTEALRWWRSTDGFIDEGLLETVLSSRAGSDAALRAEIARALFSIGTRRSLQAQLRLAGTDGVADDPSGEPARIACTAIRNFARSDFQEAAPALINSLADPSREVRACAADALSSLSGRSYAFDPAPGADEARNQDAIARWRAWWQERDIAIESPGGGSR